MGWFEIGPAPDPATDKGLLIQQQIQAFLDESADKVSIENSSITKPKELLGWSIDKH
jgi:hypothetical protein